MIGYFLDHNSISYRYEQGVLIKTADGKNRIWYPDFYLPEFGKYIEYYGLISDRNYRKSVQTKETEYSKNKIDVIPVYPWMFDEDWEGYIMKGLKNVIAHRYRNLMKKPYWSKMKSRPYNNSFRSPRRFFY